MSEERKDRCATCRFWVEFGEDNLNKRKECRRFPPVMLPVLEDFVHAGDRFLGAFPETAAASWCGEWQPTTDSKEVCDMRAQMQAMTETMRTLTETMKGGFA